MRELPFYSPTPALNPPQISLSHPIPCPFCPHLLYLVMVRWFLVPVPVTSPSPTDEGMEPLLPTLASLQPCTRIRAGTFIRCWHHHTTWFIFIFVQSTINSILWNCWAFLFSSLDSCRTAHIIYIPSLTYSSLVLFRAAC
ncbi:hypothetical protein DFP73DRAFT_539541 [Morchella snyderi]|nr:hypothetical protein DFP73DRAFT_539541 [Morchella snyderi]